MSGETDAPNRDIAPLAGVGLVLIATSFLGLVSRARAVRDSRFGVWGMRLAVIGTLTLIGGIASNAISEDLPPFFVAPGGVILVAGLLLVTVHVAGAKVLPPWSMWLLLLGVLALIGVNDQNARILLMVPFGMAWIAVGVIQ